MSKLFQRAWTLTIGTYEMSTLDFSGRVRKTLKPEPNSCELKVYNINPSHRALLEQSAPGKKNAKPIPVKIELGYKDRLTQIFLGEVRNVQTKIDGPDIITELATDDGKKAIGSARLNLSIGPKTPNDVALRAIASALGVGPGNLQAAANKLKLKGLATIYGKGATFTGNAWIQIQDFCNSAGLEASIQDNKLQILDRGKALDGTAVELSAESGLVGSPEVDNKGVAKARVLMIPGMRPGAKVSFNAAALKGGFRLTECDYVFDSSAGGQDWYIDITGEKY